MRAKNSPTAPAKCQLFDAPWQCFFEQKQLGQAVACFSQVLQLQPHYAEASFNLATVLQVQGKLDAAVECYRRAISLKPGYADAHGNLGLALKLQGKFDEAAASFKQALALNPKLFAAHNNLGNVYALQGQLDNAISHYRQALRLQPNAVDTLVDLSTVLSKSGRVAESVKVLRQVLALKSARSAEIHSSLLFTLLLNHQCDSETLFQEHLAYANTFEKPLKASWQPHDNSRDPDRRLKIGYVSGDFCGHAVSYFIEPVLPHHERSQFDIYAYYTTPTATAIPSASPLRWTIGAIAMR